MLLNIQFGCRVEPKNRCGPSSIFYAIQRGHLEIVERLKAHMADRKLPPQERLVSSRDDSSNRLGNTPMAACVCSEDSVLNMIEKGDLETIRLIRERRCSLTQWRLPTVKDFDGRIRWRGWSGQVSRLERREYLCAPDRRVLRIDTSHRRGWGSIYVCSEFRFQFRFGRHLVAITQ
jgi:hypothetical protein